MYAPFDLPTPCHCLPLFQDLNSEGSSKARLPDSLENDSMRLIFTSEPIGVKVRWLLRYPSSHRPPAHLTETTYTRSSS